MRGCVPETHTRFLSGTLFVVYLFINVENSCFEICACVENDHLSFETFSFGSGWEELCKNASLRFPYIATNYLCFTARLVCPLGAVCPCCFPVVPSSLFFLFCIPPLYNTSYVHAKKCVRGFFLLLPSSAACTTVGRYCRDMTPPRAASFLSVAPVDSASPPPPR